MTELKPCPFCGSESRLFETGNYTAHYAVCCTECLCRTHEQDTEEEAVSVWNRRVSE